MAKYQIFCGYANAIATLLGGDSQRKRAEARAREYAALPNWRPTIMRVIDTDSGAEVYRCRFNRQKGKAEKV